jgi:release factor glutamine methyltransferase
MTLETALRQGKALLEEAAVPAARLTAEVLLAHAVQRDRVYLFAHAQDELSELGWIHYGRYLHQRLQGTPTQYITKKQEFYGREFRVTPAVLIPRPETEHVVEAAVARLAPGAMAVDIGTGSGAIACTIALEGRARVLGTDVSEPALRIAAENAHRLGATVDFVCCDLLAGFDDRRLDMVVSNPPYVGLDEAEGLQREVREWEPHVALFAGEDGNTLYRRIIRDCERVLKPGGWVVLELGWKSADAVRALLGRGWTDIEMIPDLAGIRRVAAARWSP